MSDAAFATLFAHMADRIRKSDPADFAGAVVIVPPSGDPITYLVNDPKPSLAQFWTGLQGRITVAAADAQQDEARQNPWGAQRNF